MLQPQQNIARKGCKAPGTLEGVLINAMPPWNSVNSRNSKNPRIGWVGLSKAGSTRSHINDSVFCALNIKINLQNIKPYVHLKLI